MIKRVVYFDVLNIISALAVVYLHCSGVHTFRPTVSWSLTLIIEVAFFWAVPVFVMLSGANLMGYRERYSTKEFFKKRVLKTVIPFAVWSLIAAAVRGIFPWNTEGGSDRLYK